MAAFDYVALDLSGRTRQGVVAAADEGQARASLKRRRLEPLRLTPTATARSSGPSAVGAMGAGLGAKDRALFTRQLATLTTVSPLEEALRTIMLQADKARLKAVLVQVHAAVLEGYRLSEALARPKGAFPPLYRAMVAAGESSGALPAILDRLADLLDHQQQVRAKIAAALVYPIVLAVVACLVIAILMTFVIPKVVEQFDSMGQTLPLLTRMIIGLSSGLRRYGVLLLAAAAGGTALFALGLRRPAFRLRVDAALLATPLLGRLIREVHAAQLARTLATMIAAGLPVLEGLALTAGTLKNRVMRGAVETMVDAIREGGALSAAMRRAGVFPPVLVYMTASGESSGRVETMLSRAADYLEREFATFTATFLSLLEPAIIVVLGAIVATIVLSILLPILQINTLALH